LSFATLLTCGACYWLFSTAYRSSLERQNSIQLKSLSAQLDERVFQYTRQHFISLSQNVVLYRNINTFFADPVSLRHVKIINAVMELRSLVTFSSGVIGSVDIYYPGDRISISSLSGFTDLTTEPAREDRLLWENIMTGWKGYNWWDVRQINRYQEVNVTYFGAVPASRVEDARGLVAITVSPQVISGYLSALETPDTKYYLLTEELFPIYGDLTELEIYFSRDELLEIVQPRMSAREVRQVSSSPNEFVSYIQLEEFPSVLVSVVSTGVFRKEMGGILFVVLLIGVLVFFGGLIASGFFSLRLYRPLKQLVLTMAKLPELGEASYFRNEYSYLDHALTRLYRQEAEYERAFTDYSTAIVKDFEKALNEGRPKAVTELLERFQGLCGNLEYSNPQSRKYCRALIDVFTQYLETHKANEAVEQVRLETFGTIRELCGRLEEAVGHAFEFITSQNHQRVEMAAKLLAYIKDNLAKPISQDSAADYCGKSAGYIGKLIKQETGESWVDYLNKLRLEASLEFLNDSSLKVEEAAAQVGFNGAAYFIKRFKERYGLTPMAWRKRQKINSP
jgi:AraC-like DNA-binding protein